ncbi:hypothetical protein MRX96_052921 [Rhipicephalus microplus]
MLLLFKYWVGAVDAAALFLSSPLRGEKEEEPLQNAGSSPLSDVSDNRPDGRRRRHLSLAPELLQIGPWLCPSVGPRTTTAVPAQQVLEKQREPFRPKPLCPPKSRLKAVCVTSLIDAVTKWGLGSLSAIDGLSGVEAFKLAPLLGAMRLVPFVPANRPGGMLRPVLRPCTRSTPDFPIADASRRKGHTPRAALLQETGAMIEERYSGHLHLYTDGSVKRGRLGCCCQCHSGTPRREEVPSSAPGDIDDR